MAKVFPPTEVLPTSEARRYLTAIAADFREHGAASGPILFGSRRKPEAAIVPYELIELLDPIVEDLVIAARARERLIADDGTRHTVEDVAASLGLDVD
jgi:hypothetical protein